MSELPDDFDLVTALSYLLTIYGTVDPDQIAQIDAAVAPR
ncbi:hypothetical protein SEA_OREGANO_3 [Gordonia phage Oregano]|nr:hypothetical protein SEA_OREGANO_3 [Gordonia phage Oregano]